MRTLTLSRAKPPIPSLPPLGHETGLGRQVLQNWLVFSSLPLYFDGPAKPSLWTRAPSGQAQTCL